MAAAKSKKATVITYTENELKAIEILKAHKGTPMTAAELGVPTAVLTSLMNKSTDERPMGEGFERVLLNKEDKTVVVEVEKTLKAYTLVD